LATSLADLVGSIIYFAPNPTGFANQPPTSARVLRLNLFVYSGGSMLELKGTLNTNGTRISMDTPMLGINASVLDKAILNSVANNAANTSTLTTLHQAWTNNAEIWLYTSGGVPTDALAQAFATFMGATIRAFSEPFWVLPQLDAQQKTILARDEIGIGADFKAALGTKTKLLRALDTLSSRHFTP
jgi:hypothetical protein